MIINNIKLHQKNIMVIGDIMLDTYIFGKVNRISPEAPVPIVDINHEEDYLGGSGNVLRNLIELNVNPTFHGYVGTDLIGKKIKNNLLIAGINVNTLINDKKINSLQKIRIIGDNQQIVRLDKGSYNLQKYHTATIIDLIIETMKNTDGIIISDYGKGTCNETVVINTISQATKLGLPVFIDPKGLEWNKYKYADFITPNTKEAEFILNCKLNNNNDYIEGANQIRKKYEIKSCLITRGDEGMTYVDEKIEVHIPAIAKQVYDVTGAGDTVISCFSASICNGNDIKDSLQFSNNAAGYVVSKFGTTPVNPREL